MATVSAILCVRRLSQIGEDVIQRVAVNVVNLIFWPLSGYAKPRETMR